MRSLTACSVKEDTVTAASLRDLVAALRANRTLKRLRCVTILGGAEHRERTTCWQSHHDGCRGFTRLRIRGDFVLATRCEGSYCTCTLFTFVLMKFSFKKNKIGRAGGKLLAELLKANTPLSTLGYVAQRVALLRIRCFAP